ncbi:MAG TPA: DUF296 domain-containing protein [Methanoregulaceae archaeon]|nr:DUF296 domain-containing protein [Methanoregulaceae archaeon]
MEYTEGRIGRIFILRIDHGEDFLSEMDAFVRKKGINCGIVQFLGALAEGRMVTGPEKAVLPPSPHFEGFSGGWEIFGTASIFTGSDGPHIHYHASAGRGAEALTGCLREKAEAYIVVEVFITEIIGIQARRTPEPVTGLNLPSFGRKKSDQ